MKTGFDQSKAKRRTGSVRSIATVIPGFLAPRHRKVRPANRPPGAGVLD
jgi:hypothetical protein